MRKPFVYGILLTALAGASSATAADLGAPVYKAPPAPIYNWTGIYFGGHIGGGWSPLTDTVVTPFAGGAFPAGTTFATDNLSGVLGGLQVGFNWQFNNNWVIGFEGDYSWSDLTGSATSTSPVFPAVTSVVNATGSDIALATARLGYAWNNWLFYAKGGGAWGRGSTTGQTFLGTTLVNTTSSNADRAGWTIGGGIEWGFLNNWSAKVEYNYIDFGTQSVTVNGTSGAIAGTTSLVNGRETVNVLKVGVNYRFNVW